LLQIIFKTLCTSQLIVQILYYQQMNSPIFALYTHMPDFFKDKVVAITGGSDGIGRALIEALLEKGAKVATCARHQGKLYDLQLKYSAYPLHCVVADVSVLNDCKMFIESTLKQFGEIDILINNAGISMRAQFKEAELEVFRKIMDINFFGTLYCTKLALDSLIRRKGTIVGVSSIAGFRGLPGRSGYSASKFALNGWLESIRTELQDDGVHVLCACPGYTRSNIRNAALNGNAVSQGETPLDESQLMSAEEVAGHILKAIEKRKRNLILTITGKEAVLLNKFFPSLADKMMKKVFYKDGKLVK
jgi:short-subunit dehydrogenase